MGVLITRLQQKLSFSCHLAFLRAGLYILSHMSSKCLDACMICPEDLREFSRDFYGFVMAQCLPDGCLKLLWHAETEATYSGSEYMDHVEANNNTSDRVSRDLGEMALPEALLWHAETKDSLSKYMELVEAEGSVFIKIGPSKPALASHGVSSSGPFTETARMLRQRSVRCGQRLRAALDAQAQRIAATDAANGAQPCGSRIISIIHPKQLPRGRQRGAGSHPHRGDCTDAQSAPACCVGGLGAANGSCGSRAQQGQTGRTRRGIRQLCCVCLCSRNEGCKVPKRGACSSPHAVFSKVQCQC